MRQRGASFVGLEAVILGDSNPRQFLPPPRQFVAAPCQFLFGLEQFAPGGKQLFTCSSLMLSHRFLLSFCRCVFVLILACELLDEGDRYGICDSLLPFSPVE